MWGRIASLIVKELLASVRDRQTQFVVLAVPLISLLIYSFAVTQEVKNVSMAVLNQDLGPAARELIAQFESSPTFTRIEYVNSPSEIASSIDSKAVIMALHIGSDFSRRIAAGEPGSVQVILDGRRSNAAQILLGYVTQIVERFNQTLAERSTTLPVPMPLVISRLWFNPNARSLWSAVPGLFAVIATFVGLMVSALAIARERELGSVEQLLVSPLQPFEILFGKAIPGIVIALFSGTVMILLSWFVLGVPLRGSLLLLYISLIIYLTATVGIGLFISSLAVTQQQALIGLLLYMTPAVLMSGFASPVENMPDWLQWVAGANPLMHFVVICKAIFLKDTEAAVLLRHVWPIVLIALAKLSAATWLFRRRVV
ncbi:MAG: ABC transporter permease [Rhodospirillales bacterium]|nr:ABC transporter permease [Rhodospirillales bacterium]